MVEWIALQKECKELKKKKEGWYDTKHQYRKIIIKYKHKKGGLDKEKGFWLQEQETEENAIEKMSIQILHMKSMIVVEEFHRWKVRKKRRRQSWKYNQYIRKC